jgi:hypothetical protein
LEDGDSKEDDSKKQITATKAKGDLEMPLSLTGEKSSSRIWETAYSKLKEQEKDLVKDYEKILNSSADFPSDLPADHRMWYVAQMQFRIWNNKQWKIRLPFTDKKTIAVRDLAPKIAKVFQSVTTLGSVAASVDPIHAGIPFAGICVLLQVRYLLHLVIKSLSLVFSKARYRRFRTRGENA